MGGLICANVQIQSRSPLSEGGVCTLLLARNDIGLQDIKYVRAAVSFNLHVTLDRFSTHC